MELPNRHEEQEAVRRLTEAIEKLDRMRRVFDELSRRIDELGSSDNGTPE